jgi:hypothetical protein
MPSIVAEIGYCLEEHFKSTGIIKIIVNDNVQKSIEYK